MQIDGNALRAARREAAREPIEYTLDDETFTFPVEMPLEVVLAAGDFADRARYETVARGLKAAFGDEQWPRFLAHRPSKDDCIALWADLLTAYSVTEGESSSSPASSATGGESSKPSSNDTTESTPGPSSRKAKAHAA